LQRWVSLMMMSSPFGQILAGRHFFAHVGAVKQDAGQGIVDFMGDPGRQAAQRRQLVHLGGQVIKMFLLVFH
jgi:hypothetical protein